MKVVYKVFFTIAALAFACFAIHVTRKMNRVHVPGVGQVIWQDGTSRRWILFPEEKCR